MTFVTLHSHMFLPSRNKKLEITVASSVLDLSGGRTSVRFLIKITVLPLLIQCCRFVVYEAHKLAPQVPNPEPSYDPATADWPVKYDVSREAKLLGVQYKTREETTKDTIDDFKARGWF